MRVKERLKVELHAETVRNDERQTRVNMCEQALKNSQAQVASLEQEVLSHVLFMALFLELP